MRQNLDGSVHHGCRCHRPGAMVPTRSVLCPHTLISFELHDHYSIRITLIPFPDEEVEAWQVRWPRAYTFSGSLESDVLTAPLLPSSVTKICAQCEMEHSADGLMEQMCSSDFGECGAQVATAPVPPPALLPSHMRAHTHTHNPMPSTVNTNSLCIVDLFFFLWSFCLLGATPVAYGGSQARGQIRTIGAGLHQSHSTSGSELHLQPTPQLMATLDPQLTEQGQGSNPHLYGY